MEDSLPAASGPQDDRRNRKRRHRSTSIAAAKRVVKPSIRDLGPPITSTLQRGPNRRDRLSQTKESVYVALTALLKETGTTKQKLSTQAKKEAADKIMAIDAVRAISMAMDESMLESFLDGVLADEIAASLLACFGDVAKMIVNDCKEVRVKGSENTVQPRSSQTRCAQQTVRGWYGESCAITAEQKVDACHIVADCILRDQKRAASFWSRLSMFWPIAEIRALQAHLRQPQMQTTNLIVLGKHVHARWTDGEFGLLPIDVDDTNGSEQSSELRLEFSWMGFRSQNFTWDYPEEVDRPIVNVRTPGQVMALQSGDIIHLRNRDATRYKLPDTGLLKLRWHLTQALHLVGGADVMKLLFRKDDNEDPTTIQEWEDQGYKAGQRCPFFAKFLITRAREQGLIQDEELPIFVEELRAETPSSPPEDVDDIKQMDTSETPRTPVRPSPSF